MTEQENILIIGASAAGVSAAKEARAASTSARITLITDESPLPYYRPLLTRRIVDEAVERNPAFLLNKPEWYAENRIELIPGEAVNRISPEARTVTTANRREIPWETLVVAGGASPLAPVSGALDHENVFAIRTLDDARAAFRCQQTARRITIIGGGVLGLETADILFRAGKSVCVVELADRILPVQLDPEGSALFQTVIGRTDCPLFLGDAAESFAEEGRVTAVRLRSGREIPSDMVLFAIGVRPNLALTRNTGLRTNRGIVVNERMETNLPGIFACGDISEFGDTARLWMPAVRQGAVAGRNAAGGDAVFEAVDYPASLTAFGTRVFSIGDIGGKAPGEAYTQEERVSPDRGIYRKLYFRDGRLVGGVFIGDSGNVQALVRAVRSGASREDAAPLIEG